MHKFPPSIRFCPSCEDLRYFNLEKSINHSCCAVCGYHGIGCVTVSTYVARKMENLEPSHPRRFKIRRCKSCERKQRTIDSLTGEINSLKKKLSDSVVC